MIYLRRYTTIILTWWESLWRKDCFWWIPNPVNMKSRNWFAGGFSSFCTSGWTKRYWTTMVETHQPELWPSVAPSKNLWRFILNKQITSRRRRRRIETAVILEKTSTQTASRKNTPSSQMPGSLANFGRTKRTGGRVSVCTSFPWRSNKYTGLACGTKVGNYPGCE